RRMAIAGARQWPAYANAGRSARPGRASSLATVVRISASRTNQSCCSPKGNWPSNAWNGASPSSHTKISATSFPYCRTSSAPSKQGGGLLAVRHRIRPTNESFHEFQSSNQRSGGGFSFSQFGKRAAEARKHLLLAWRYRPLCERAGLLRILRRVLSL